MNSTTHACKVFLSTHAEIIGESNAQTWTRVSKRVENGVTFRGFKNSEGRVVTVADRNGVLSIAAVTLCVPTVQPAETPVFGKLLVGENPTEAVLVDFIIDCLRQDPSNVRNNADTLAHAMDSKNWSESFVKVSPFNFDNEVFKLEDFVDLPYVSQPSDLDYANISRIYEFYMPYFDTTYRFPIYLSKTGHIYIGANDPD